MLGPLETARQLDALGKYFTLRMELKDALDSLEGDPCWKVLLDAEGDHVSNWPLAKLIEFQCPSGPLRRNEGGDPPKPQTHEQGSKETKPRSENKESKTRPFHRC
jgi:hypothetical protein